MKTASREGRRDEIMDVAVKILSEKGYRDASMLEVARRASASKETLYAWFGDKQGLLEALISRNARTVQDVLARHLDGDAPPERLLFEFGRALLELLLGESAVALNRAAISEAPSDPTLARLLASAGRETVLPSFVRLLEIHNERATLSVEDSSRAAEDFLGLLLGDTQVRRLLGVMPPPGKAQISARARRATDNFLRLYGGKPMS
jgi:AcrR family transcriptional regulator